jgi:hypothetical protein
LYAAATPLFRRSLKPYQGVSSFSKIAFLPDTVTSDEVGVVFDRFNAALPSPLRSSRKKTSANWHYINDPFDKKNGCGGKFLNRSSNIEWALKKLIKSYKSYKSAKDDNARALTLAFIDIGTRRPIALTTGISWLNTLRTHWQSRAALMRKTCR